MKVKGNLNFQDFLNPKALFSHTEGYLQIKAM